MYIYISLHSRSEDEKDEKDEDDAELVKEVEASIRTGVRTKASPVNHHRKDIWTHVVNNARLRSKQCRTRTGPDECQDFFLFWELNLRVDQV